MPASQSATHIAMNVGAGAVVALPFSVFGIPAWGLAAAVTGAFCSYLPARGIRDIDVPLAMLSIGKDAIIGSWLAIFIVRLHMLDDTGIDSMPIEILCGLAAFVMQWLSKKVSPKMEQLLGRLVVDLSAAIASWIRRPHAQAPQPPPPEPDAPVVDMETPK